MICFSAVTVIASLGTLEVFVLGVFVIEMKTFFFHIKTPLDCNCHATFPHLLNLNTATPLPILIVTQDMELHCTESDSASVYLSGKSTNSRE